MQRPVVLAMLGGLAVGAAVALAVIAGTTVGGPQTQTLGKPLIGGPFSLVDQTGKRVTQKDFSDRDMLVFFGYTSCPDICPTGLQVMSAALDKLGAKADAVTPVFITLDPERDTPARLAEYLKSFHPRLVGLTGSPEEIAAVANAYRVYYKKIPDENDPNNYTLDHSAFMYLMDKSGSYLAHFSSTIAVDDLADRLAKAL